MFVKFFMLGAHYRVSVFLFLLIGSLIAAAGLPKLHVDTGVGLLIGKHDPDKIRYEEVVSQFGSDNTSIIYIRDPKLFSPDKLARLQKLVDDLAALDVVEKVDSLFNVTSIRDRDGALDSHVVLEPLPATQAEADAAREDALHGPMLRRNYISENGQVMAINVRLLETGNEAPGATEDASDRSYRLIEEHIDALRGDFTEVFQIGNARIGAELKQGMNDDLQILTPLSTGLLLATVVVFLRRGSVAIFPLATATLSILWTFGFMGYAGIPVTILTAILPSLLMVIGSAEDIHMVASYLEAFERDPKTDRRGAVLFVAKILGTPLLVNVATTVFGFGSNIITDMELISDFALASAVGILLNAVITFLAMPLMLSLWGPLPRKNAKTHAPTHMVPPFFDKLSTLVANFSVNHGKVIGGVTVLLTGGALWLAQDLEFNNDPLSFFNEDAGIRQAAQSLHDDLSGVQLFFITVDGRRPGAFREPDNLRLLAAIREKAEAQGSFDKVVALSDHLSLVNREMNGGDPAHFTVPDNRDLVDQFLLFFQRSDLERFVSSDYRTANIVVRHNLNNSRIQLEEVEKLKAEVTKMAEATGMRVDFVGKNLLVSRASRDMVMQQFPSLALIMGAVFVVLTILFGSPYAGLLCLIPNVVPIALSYGAMVLMGIALSPATVLVADIAIGIAVDDTTHLLIRYNAEARKGGKTADALKRTIAAEMVPVLSTSVALTLGFLVVSFSSFSNISDFGITSAIIMVMALLCDLLVTPTLIANTRLVTLWDILSLNIGRDIIQRSPLFAGMKTRQVKTLVLLSEVRDIRAGEAIIEQGAHGRDMFVLLSGTAEVARRDETGREHVLTHLQTGDVFGEVAFVGDVVRTAAIRCTADGQVMLLSHGKLQQRLRSYPRLAASVYRNVSRILGSRLVSVMDR